MRIPDELSNCTRGNCTYEQNQQDVQNKREQRHAAKLKKAQMKQQQQTRSEEIELQKKTDEITKLHLATMESERMAKEKKNSDQDTIKPSTTDSRPCGREQSENTKQNGSH